MASQNNINKFRRLSNTIQVKTTRHSTIDPDRLSQTVKLPALNAITKSIKYNDLSFTFSRDLNKLRKQPEGPDSLAQSLAHGTLMTIRKRYDGVNKQRQTEQSLIHQLQIERERFRIQRDQYAQEKAKGEQRVKHFEQDLKNIKIKCEESDMERKVVLNMSDRLKYDKIVFDQRKFIMQATLNFIAKQKNIILKESASMKEEEDKTKKVYQKMVEHLEEQERERQLHLQSIGNMIQQKTAANEGNINRHTDMKEIAENTLSEKDRGEKSWYKVYLCQRFVQKLLRDKMAKQMSKFGTVQLAFKNIKTATGVNTTDDLVKKFLNKEGGYGDLLGKIAENEKKIVQLKMQNDSLNKERTKLKAEQSALNVNKRDGKDLSQQEKLFHIFDEKSINCELFVETIKIWLSRIQKKFKVFNNQKQVQVEIPDTAEEIINHFKYYLEGMNHETEQPGEAEEDKKFDNSGIKKSNNLRIPLQGDEAKRKTQKKQKLVTEYNQDEHVNNLRLQLIRNNDKHMKQLKKKYEEIKRQRMQNQPRKKDVVPSPQKPRQPAAAQIK